MKYVMGLENDLFKQIKLGKKSTDLYLLDDAKKQLKPGNIITYYNNSKTIEKLDTIVKNITIYENIEDALSKLEVTDLGYNKLSKKEYLDYFLNTYKESLIKYKIIVINIELIQKYEKSCGIVVLNKINDKLKVLLVHHNLGHWGLPKGHIENNETETETALREVLEETNIKVNIITDFKETITYSPKAKVLKDVTFFLGQGLSINSKNQETEIQEVEWVDLDKAKDIITYNDEKKIIMKVINYLIINNIEISEKI